MSQLLTCKVRVSLFRDQLPQVGEVVRLNHPEFSKTIKCQFVGNEQVGSRMLAHFITTEVFTDGGWFAGRPDNNIYVEVVN